MKRELDRLAESPQGKNRSQLENGIAAGTEAFGDGDVHGFVVLSMALPDADVAGHNTVAVVADAVDLEALSNNDGVVFVDGRKHSSKTYLCGGVVCVHEVEKTHDLER